MVYRGRRNANRFHPDEDDGDEEEIDLRNPVTTGEAARLREAQYLAQEAIRMATEAREAVRRVKELRARLGLPDRRSNMVAVNDTSTLREGDDSCRC